jgi:hypothetical protein
MKAVFHIHTKYSFDTCLKPEEIVKKLEELRIDLAFITDHNTIRGAKEVKKIAEKRGVKIIIGAEYFTSIGDIIGIFLTQEIKEKHPLKVIEKIKSQGGLSILPHPYKSHTLFPTLISKIDLIEVFNSRTPSYLNALALRLAEKYNKPKIIGSDAHFLSEIDLTIMEINSSSNNLKSALLRDEVTFLKQERTKIFYPILTGITKLYKKSDPTIIINWFKKGYNFLFNSLHFKV